MTRYIVENASGRTQMWWRVRARVVDTATGETIELRSDDLARTLRAALEAQDAGDLAALPTDASPFRRFEAMSGSGWQWLIRANGAADHVSVGRTRSQSFVRRAAEVLNRTYPRKLRTHHGPINAGWW